MDIMVAIAAAGKALEGLKLLRDVDKSFDEAVFKSRIAQITSDVVDLKVALSEAKSELSEKDAEIARLTKEFAFKGETIFKNGFTYEKSKLRDGPQGMPFCPRCEQVDGRHIRLASGPGMSSNCPQCKSGYYATTSYIYDDIQ